MNHPPQSAPSAAPVSVRGMFFWLSAGHFANDCGPGAVWLVAPAAALAFGYGPAETGLLITCASVGAALAYAPAGVLADRVSDQGRLLWLSFIWVAAGYALASLAGNFWMLALLLALAGLGDAAWHPVATGVLVRLRPGRRAEALGVHAIGGTLSEVAAPLAAGFLIAAFDWRAAVLCSALPALVMALLFIRVRRRVPQAAAARITRADLGAMARAWARPHGLMLIGVISLYNMANIAVLSMTPVFLRDAHAFTPDETGAVFAAIILLGALAQPLAGRLSDLIGRRPLTVAGNLAAAAAALAVWRFGGGDLWIALGGLTAAVAALYGVRSVMLAAAVDYAGTREATTLGFAFMVMDGVGALGAVLAGAAAAVDVTYAFAAAALLAGSAALGACWIMPRASEDSAASAGRKNRNS